MRTYSRISIHFGFVQLSFYRQNCVFYKVATIIQFNWRHKKTQTGRHKIASYEQKRTYAYWDTSNNTSLVHFIGAFVLKTYFRCYKAAKAAAIHYFLHAFWQTLSVRYSETPRLLWDSPAWMCQALRILVLYKNYSQLFPPANSTHVKQRHECRVTTCF